MSLIVYSGKPGSGKTLQLLDDLVYTDEWKIDSARQVFYCGFRNLDATKLGWIELFDPKRWYECPPGSVIVCDEAWRWFGKSQRLRYRDERPTVHLPWMSEPITCDDYPPHVALLAVHRQGGYDIVFTTQSVSKQLSPFIHELIDQHVHSKRLANTKTIRRWTNDGYIPSLTPAGLKDVPMKLRKLPVRSYELYQSAFSHQERPRTPTALYVIVGIVLLFAFGVWRALFSQSGTTHSQLSAEAQAGDHAPASSTPKPLPRNATHAAEVKLPGVEHSGVRYDQLPPCIGTMTGIARFPDEDTHQERTVAYGRTDEGVAIRFDWYAAYYEYGPGRLTWAYGRGLYCVSSPKPASDKVLEFAKK